MYSVNKTRFSHCLESTFIRRGQTASHRRRNAQCTLDMSPRCAPVSKGMRLSVDVSAHWLAHTDAMRDAPNV